MNVHPVSIRAALVLLVSTLGCIGCNRVVYSPFTTLPAAPLVKDQGEVAANANVLPGVTGGIVPGTYFYASGDLLLRYAFSDRVTLQTRGWATFSSLQNIRMDGFSVEGMVMLNDSSSPYRLGLMPRAEFLLNGANIQGQAAFLHAVAWTPTLAFLHPFVGLGAGIGRADIDNGNGGSSGSAWGYALLGNLGANVNLFSALAVSAELAGVVQDNRYDHSVYAFVLPSLGLSYRF